ncbi:hypothetical protein Tco_0672016 [Tanacetum coccineum]
MDIPAKSLCPSCKANAESANHVSRMRHWLGPDMCKHFLKDVRYSFFSKLFPSWDSFNDWNHHWHASNEKTTQLASISLGMAFLYAKVFSFRLASRRFEMVLLFFLLSGLVGVFIQKPSRSENRWLGPIYTITYDHDLLLNPISQQESSSISKTIPPAAVTMTMKTSHNLLVS